MRVAHDFWIRFKSLARKLSPPQLVLAGFLSYVALGLLVLSLPLAQTSHVGFVDNLFMITSAMSTTGLTTVSTADDYTWLGQLTLLVLIQLGGIGYMVVSSFVILARRQNLGPSRENVLKAQFSLPADFNIRQFVWHVCIFTLLIEALGAAVLFFEFRAAGVEDALWQAIFHSISAFCTAGFSLFNDSMMGFSGNTAVCVTIMLLSYLGGIGFIVLADLWLCLCMRGRKLTFTSRVILAMTLGVFASSLLYPLCLVITVVLYAVQPLVQLDAGPWLIGLAGLNLLIFVAGYAVMFVLGRRALRQRHISGWLGALVTMPVYWFMMSAAAWYALWQFMAAPFHWNKTEHGLSALQKRQRSRTQGGPSA